MVAEDVERLSHLDPLSLRHVEDCRLLLGEDEVRTDLV